MSAWCSAELNLANSEPNNSLEFCGMTSHYRVKWNLSMKSFNKTNAQHKCKNPLQRSNLFRVKSTSDLSFYLELYCDHSYYDIRIKTKPGEASVLISLEHAFITFPGLFTLTSETSISSLCSRYDYFDHENFLEKGTHTDCDTVAVYCAICIKGSVSCAWTIEGRPEAEVVECKIAPVPEATTRIVELQEYMFSGKIPTFTEDLAISWIREASRLGLDELVDVGTRYLECNLSTDNVAEALHLALDMDKKRLAKRCAYFLGPSQKKRRFFY